MGSFFLVVVIGRAADKCPEADGGYPPALNQRVFSDGWS
ncbi:hypothetical protein DET0469 [Dehalococcoides mccartyi 195]|uniref:Uncharacterized protein n=1 Tax=Dehalococcoides mccartyi (strain ATCC BAA-2266 / KCTC 15142 / 195) TaxID=243164 RepID=Q3Z986_DEHM1|nr:hypothetical protein DET0469 [Dehalococcoides mccartyi 195]POZ58649.1 hypothetical protein C1O63_0985 [Dehalococcoides mccartyi]